MHPDALRTSDSGSGPDKRAGVVADSGHVIALFDTLNRSGIRYAVLHGAGDIPDGVGSDIDMIVDAGSFDEFATLLADFAADRGGVLCQSIAHEPTACYSVLALPGPNGMPTFLKVDFSSDFRRDGRILFTGPELLQDAYVNGHAWSVSTGREFAAYLAKCVLKRRLSSEQMAGLAALWSADSKACRTEIGKLLAAAEVDTVAEAMSGAVTEESVNRLLALRGRLLAGAFRNHPLATLAYPFRHLARALYRASHRTGLQVAVLGPDGIGKSSVITGLREALAPAFRANVRLHLRPGLLPPKATDSAEGTVAVPYLQDAYGPVKSVLKLAYLVTDYTLGYWACVWPKLVRSTLVVCDRYYLDVVADPVRYRYGGPGFLPQAVGRLIPGLISTSCSPHRSIQSSLVRPRSHPSRQRHNSTGIERWSKTSPRQL